MNPGSKGGHLKGFQAHAPISLQQKPLSGYPLTCGRIQTSALLNLRPNNVANQVREVIATRDKWLAANDIAMDTLMDEKQRE